MKTHYYNRLPHIAPIGATFFVTFRQHDSLPQAIVKQLKAELEQDLKRIEKENPKDKEERIREARKRNFGQYGHQLDNSPYGSCQLQNPQVAQILIERINGYDSTLIDLQALCIMPNHVHMLFSLEPQLKKGENEWLPVIPEDYVQLHQVMQLIKGVSSRYINQVLGPKGKFWAKDSYDHFVRNNREWLGIVHYILYNPVKAGLVSSWEQWPYTILAPFSKEVYNAALKDADLTAWL